jgi:signal transduction protein with GAF and PtsI domain
VGRVVLDAKSIHVIDSQADPHPEVVNRARSGNMRTLLGVPLQREGTPIGVLILQRTIVQPFTDTLLLSLEQPHVLDRDYCLVSKGFSEADLLVSSN